MQNKDLPSWAQAIGSQLAEDLIEMHMWMPPTIQMAHGRLARSETRGARWRRASRSDSATNGGISPSRPRAA